jgi:hypothetical protein
MSLISFDTLVNTFDNSTEFQKLATRSMTVSSKAIRSRSYEAENLNGAMSIHTAGRSTLLCKGRAKVRYSQLTYQVEG